MRTKLAAAAMTLALLGGGGIGAALMGPSLASAADTSSPTRASASTSAKPPGAWESDALKKLVAAGTITQAQADAVIKALDAARPAGGPRRGGGPGLAVAAEAIGIDASELRTALQSGQTIADVAKQKNVDLQKVIDAIVADQSAHLADAVAAGRLTQAQADARNASAAQHATDLVNGKAPNPADGPPPNAPASPSSFSSPSTSA